ncbi:hypothetical protein DB41_DL00010 [Neochlamydia sp. TUME1]|uniref:hypothetical protein n=1 Tax=Neochlamydia sp. TUME1 TaxID=1478174 RepID=UPI000583BDC7|nr:hypothetical protein [Neochlamydia sp. TUME1]KIC77023.1 hypothetical protein DB41_DL00010 [Neochlamydia sp. TUME1]
MKNLSNFIGKDVEQKLEQTAISHAGSPLWKTADIGYMAGSQQELRQKKDRLFKKIGF